MDFRNIAQQGVNFEGVVLYNPSITELSQVYEEEEDFFFVLKIMQMSLKELMQVTEDVTEFQIFYTMLTTTQEIVGFTEEKRKCLFNFLELLFKNFKMQINNMAILFSNPTDNSFLILSNRNFENFKNSVNKMFGVSEFFEDKQQETFNPADERAKAIAAKIQKGRDKAAADKGVSETKHGLIENYISILSTGFKIPPSDICDKYTFYNLITGYKKFLAQEAWNLEIKARLAGASPRDDSPENWMQFN